MKLLANRFLLQKYFYTIVFFCSHIIYAQLSKETPLSILLDTLENQIIYQTDGSLKWIDINSLNTKKTISFPKQIISNLKPVFNKDELYLISNNSGNVYVLNDSDRLTRFDKSDIQNFFINSSVFAKNDTIFRHGGYGYWTSSNFLIYLDDSTKEWEVYPNFVNSKKPRGADSHVSILLPNDYIFFGGYTVTENGFRGKTPLNSEVWYFNFENNEWNVLGNIIPQQFDGVAGGVTIGNQFYFFDKKSNFFKLDVFENELIKYRRNPMVFNFYRISPLYHKNYLYYINLNGDLSKIFISNLTSREEGNNRFYTNSLFNNKTYAVIAFLLFLSSLAFIVKYISNLQKLAFLANGIKYMRKYVEVDSVGISIIQLAIKGEVEFSTISKLTNKPHLSKIQNERNKNKLLNEINLKIKVLTGSNHDFLIFSKSSFDRRYKVVSVNKSAFKKML